MATHRHPAAASSAVAALVALSLVASAGSPPAPAQADAEAEALARIENIVVNGAKRDQATANEVKVIHASSVVPAVPSLSLFAGDEVITGVNVSVTLIMLEAAAEQGNRVIVGPASQIGVRGQRSIFLSLGRLLADVRGFFDLHTLRATLAAKGTEFEVRVSEEETRLTVLEGVVDVVQAPPAVARRFAPALPLGFGLVRAAFRSDGSLRAALAQQPQPPAGGQPPATAPAGSQRARRTITVANRCKQRHVYDVEGPETLPWVHLFSAQRIEVEPGQSRQVEIEIQFDPTNQKPGVYKGEGSVKCLDCFNEPGCAQTRDPVAIQVGLGTPQGGTSARAMEEVVIGRSGAARPVRAQERACAAVNWTTEVIVAAQPTYSARHVLPQFESADERGTAFREARERALCRGDVEGYVTLGHVYTDWGEGPKGVEAYSKVANQPSRQNDAVFLSRMAEAYRLKGQLDDAEAQTQRALAVDREAPAALNALGNVYMDRAEIETDPQQGQQLLRRAEGAYQQASGAPSAAAAPAAQGVARANIGDVHVALGQIARERQQLDVARKEYATAEAAFKTATTAYPRYAFARVGWGDAFRELGEVASAQRNDSDSRSAYARAEQLYRSGLQNHPDLPDAWVGLGDVYRDQGRTKEAVDTYARAVRSRPIEPAGYYKLGVMLQTENPALAARYLDTHVKLRPAALRNSKTTREASRIIGTLRAKPTIKVPEVMNLDEQAAQQKLADAGLKGVVTERRPAPGRRAGVVIDQKPAVGAVVAGGSIVNLVLAAGVGPTGPGGNAPGIVPDVMNRPVDEARALLEQAGFRVRIDTKKSDRPAGTVIKQSPDARKTARPNSEVKLEVAAADTRPVSVPDVVGDSRERAIQKIRDKRLQVGDITVQASCEEAGKVISQAPKEDAKVTAGTPVSFVVAGPGETPARVPRLIGLRQNDAEEAIRRSRLRTGKQGRRETDQQAEGTVLDQKPDANAVLAPGCPVEMTVAVPIPLVEVPNFIGMTETDAKRRLPSGFGGVLAELRLGEVTYQDAPYGIESRVRTQITTPTVTGQSPSAGARVRRGSAVNLTVLRPRQGGGGTSDAPTTVQVPNVRGMTLAAAQRTLTGAGLTVGSVQEVQVRDATAGTVVQQGPDPGGMVQRGTRVNLAVARRVETPRTVPNVVGLDQGQAKARLAQYGFTVGSVTFAEDGKASGRVIRQSPGAGTPAPAGTAVNLVVSGLR